MNENAFSQPVIKVMIIDDEISFSRLVKLNLEASGNYQVEIVNEPLRARSAARECRPDIVLLDIVMPAMDGGDLLAQFRGDSLLMNVPVIFLTALIEIQERAPCLDGSMILPKPVKLEKLISTMKVVLSGRLKPHVARERGDGRSIHQWRIPEATPKDFAAHSAGCTKTFG